MRGTLKALCLIPAYGVIRKIPQVWGAKVHDHKYDTTTNAYVTRPMLQTEKVFVCATSALVSPSMCWVWLYSDMCKVEIMMRKHKLEDYGYSDKPRDIFDYCFR